MQPKQLTIPFNINPLTFTDLKNFILISPERLEYFENKDEEFMVEGFIIPGVLKIERSITLYTKNFNYSIKLDNGDNKYELFNVEKRVLYNLAENRAKTRLSR